MALILAKDLRYQNSLSDLSNNTIIINQSVNQFLYS